MTSIFDLRDHLSRKAEPARIAADDAHVLRVEQALGEDILEVQRHLEETLLHQTGDAAGRVEREARVDHFRARLRGLQRVELDAVLGRMTPQDGSAPLYVGRLAVHDAEGTPLLVDWRSPAAEPFFAATRAHPCGLRSRRRYRWEGGRIRDYWDETLGEIGERTDDDVELWTSPDEESALLDALTRARTPQMGTVLTTLAADQDAIIRASSRRPLVVEGGPGTGKTVVALHRTAYLLYTDPRLRDRRGGVLVIGPHQPYLRYVADVLPSLGEEDVLTCTLADLVPEGAHAAPESDPEVAALKAGPALVAAIEPAVALYEEAPEVAHLLESVWGPVQLEPEHFADAFEAVHPSTPHNLARDEIWEELAEIVLAQIDGGEEVPDVGQVREELVADEDLVAIVHRAWPLLDASDLVGDLFEVPAYLRRCAPALSRRQAQLLQRERPRAWSVEDLPLLDAARYRLGDPCTDARRRRQDAARRETVEEVELMTDYLIASDSSDMQEMSMLRGEDLRTALAESTYVEDATPDALSGPFANVVVDEAQELSDAQWAMILRRCPSGSLTVVGDRAQAAHGFTETWEERLGRVGLERVERSTLSLNYRTPAEVMEHAEPVIRAALPDANVPTSIRESGMPVRHGHPEQLEEILQEWLAEHEEGTVCVIGGSSGYRQDRVMTLPPRLVKGLEFDLVVLVEPESFGGGIEGAVARYVAMTRATQELVVLSPES